MIRFADKELLGYFIPRRPGRKFVFNIIDRGLPGSMVDVKWTYSGGRVESI